MLVSTLTLIFTFITTSTFTLFIFALIIHVHLHVPGFKRSSVQAPCSGSGCDASGIEKTRPRTGLFSACKALPTYLYSSHPAAAVPRYLSIDWLAKRQPRGAPTAGAGRPFTEATSQTPQEQILVCLVLPIATVNQSVLTTQQISAVSLHHPTR